VKLAAILFLMGVTVGGYGTLIGAGGGFLLMPLLLMLFPRENVPALTSLSLCVVALNAFSGTVAYAWQRRIDFRLAGMLAVVTVPGSMLGAAATGYIPRALFEVAFGCTLLVLGSLLVHRPLGKSPARLDVVGGRDAEGRRSFKLGLALSAAVGWLAGVLGIGGAPPQVVVLTHVMRIPVARAMPTVQFLVLFSAAAAVGVQVVAHGFAGSPAWILWLGAGALIGAQIGAAVSGRLSGVALVRLLASALLIVGVALIVHSTK
jgi:uncharacterized membrane protein YfcA